MSEVTGYAFREIEAVVEESERFVREQLEALERRLRDEQDAQLSELEAAYATDVERLNAELASCRAELSVLRDRLTTFEQRRTANAAGCPRPGCGGSLERRTVEGRAQLRCTEFPRCRTIVVLDR